MFAPILFNLYISDLSTLTFYKFIYIDDIVFVTHHSKFKFTEEILTKDLELLSDYLYKWWLIPNTEKTIVTTFHLNNQLAKYKPQIQFGGKKLGFDLTTKY